MADSEPPEPARPETPLQSAPARGELERQHERQRRNTRPIVILIMLLVMAALIVGGIWYWLSTKDVATTDDAFTDGRAVTISPNVSGTVVALLVADNQFVHAGDPMVRIDPSDYEAALLRAQGQVAVGQGQIRGAQAAYAVAQVNFPAKLRVAQAQVDAAHADLVRAQRDAARQHSVPAAATTRQQIDAADATLHSAQAQFAQAQANLAVAEPVKPNINQSGAQVSQLNGQMMQAQAAVNQAEIDLRRCIIRAPQDGWVTKRNVEVGNYVTPGAQIMALVSPEIWITANFKEDQLGRVRPGQHVRIQVDAYPGLKLEGHVDSVQLGSGSKFTAFPAENATGNYVKIVQRIPVKIDIDRGLDPRLPLPLGLSVTPVVDLK